MRNSFFNTSKRWIMLLPVLVLLNGCKTELDMKHLDKTVAVDMGLTVPVGSMRATLGDFLGNERIRHLYMDENGIFEYRDTISKTRNYNSLDLTDYPGEGEKEMKVYDQLQARGQIGPDGKIHGNGQLVQLDFDINVSMQKLIDTDTIRVDSAWIKTASFSSRISDMLNGVQLPLKEEWVEKVTMDLGPLVHRSDGETITICHKDGTRPFHYNEDIPIQVDNFSVCLMKNLHPSSPKGYINNTHDSIRMTVHFYLRIPVSAGAISIDRRCGFKYLLEVKMIDYHVLWGWLQPSNKMRDEDTIAIADEWSTWAKISPATLPLSEPQIDLYVNTKIAGAMVLFGDYLFAKSISGEKRWASFNGLHTREVHFQKGEYLDLDSQPGDSATMHVLFDKDPERGKLCDLFTIRPDSIGYKFHVNFDSEKTPQIRIVNNTDIRADVALRIPLRFQEGLNIQYRDTIHDVNVSSWSLDSIAKKSDILDSIKAADVKLYMTAYSLIPLHVKGVLRALDKNDEVIMDPNNPEMPLQLFSKDTICFNMPTYSLNGGLWIPTAGKTVEIVSLDNKKMNLMPEIKKIRFEAQVDTKDLHESFVAGMKEVKLTSDQSLKIQLGLTGQIDAVLNLNNK